VAAEHALLGAAVLPPHAHRLPSPPTCCPARRQQSIIDGLVSAALARVAMRPSRAQVALEAAEWRARRPAALAGISRHAADG
jgi:hypothetical protein